MTPSLEHPLHDDNTPIPLPKLIDAAKIAMIARRAQIALETLRKQLNSPLAGKEAPRLSGARVAKLAGIPLERLNYLVREKKIPPGTTRGNGRSREYTAVEAIEVIRTVGKYKQKKAFKNALAAVLAIGNFKGGVAKTTNSVSLAQGLALRGFHVLLVDLDPQASSTTSMGIMPTTEVSDDKTVIHVVNGYAADLSDAVMPTYWPNLDIIASSPALYGADLTLPVRQMKDPSFDFWTVLDKALAPLREQYDVIIIDTPPALSYMAIAAFMASDGIMIPIPPDFLDFASSTQFFLQFTEMFETFEDAGRKLDKEWDFVKIILSRVKEAAVTGNVRSWIQDTYPDLMTSIEVPESDVIKNAAAQYKTIYDLGRYSGNQKNFERVLDKFDQLVENVADGVQQIWQRQAIQANDREKQKVEEGQAAA